MGQFCFSAGRLDDARATLAKALRVLKKKEGVDVTCRFAQLEHKYGDVDKSKSMFESLLANFPKRIDVWNVYVDLLIKANDVEQARNVLSRMCCLQMRLVKKMSLFAKWRQFEQTHGTARTQEAAKRTIDELLMKEEAALDQ
ncbi:Suppressor of forked [Trinorchestia longiramus]|nr:Suppressor of forked [Trinorchestia longiramus]